MRNPARITAPGRHSASGKHSPARWGRAGATLAAGLGAVALFATPALAGTNGQTVTQTFTQHGTWTEYGDTDFCTGVPFNPTFTGNQVQHVTYFTGSDEAWGTFTEEGTVTAVINGLTYSGRITVWGNFNLNEKNQNTTFTANGTLSATDPNGVVHTEVVHEVTHMAWDAISDQPVVSFDKMNLTCS